MFFIQSGITYKYGEALAILCKSAMPIKQLFIHIAGRGTRL